MSLHPEVQSCKKGVGLQMHHAVHLPRHTESAAVAQPELRPSAVRMPHPIHGYEVGYPAVLPEIHFLHHLETGHLIHYRITFLLVVDHLVYNTAAYVRIKHKIL